MKYILDLNDENINKNVTALTFCLAAANDNYRVLELLHEKFGPLWDENTTKYAEINGHVGCLEYALSNGCSLHREVGPNQIKKKDYNLGKWFDQLQNVTDHEILHCMTLHLCGEFMKRKDQFKDIPK